VISTASNKPQKESSNLNWKCWLLDDDILVG
jgi:hypothetical protein